MGPSRREVLSATAATAAISGCLGGGLPGEATPPTSAFEVRATAEDTITLRYTGIGSQDPGKFRVVLSGAASADGRYDLDTVTGATSWTESEPITLNQTTLGLSEPLAADGLTIRLQYFHDGEWRTILRAQPAV